MVLLGLLRGLEGNARIGEIGAGILHVLVQEEPVEIIRDVVMVLHVGLRAKRVVALLDAAQRDAHPVHGRDPAGHLARLLIAHQQRDESVEPVRRAVDSAVHVSLAERQDRVRTELADDAVLGERDLGLRTGSGSVVATGAVRPGDPQAPFDNESFQYPFEQGLPHAGPP